MKSNYMNYFKDNKLYQWDKNKDIFTITKTDIKEEFCLDQKGMDMLLKFKNPEIKLGKSLQVKSGKVKANIKVCEETLNVPNMEATSTFKVNIDKLKIANKFVSTKDNRPLLTGVNISNNYVTATDSIFAFRSACENDCNVTVSSQFINILTSNLKGELELKCNSNLISCEIEDTVFIGRLIAGTYPDLQKIYEKKPANQISIKKQELKELLSYADNKNAFVTIQENKLVINGDNDFEADIELPIESNIMFMLDRFSNVVNCIEEDELVINYTDGVHPVFINNEYLLMPTRRG